MMLNREKANPLDWVFDIETYPNVCSFSFKHAMTGHRMMFEASDRLTQLDEFVAFAHLLKASGCRMIGYNNIGFDYPVIHFILENYRHGITHVEIYERAQQIIDTPWDNRFNNVIYDDDCYVQQIDLFKIHHFDNSARSTSLKMLEFNMGMSNIKDLPYPPGTVLAHHEIDELLVYNDHDVDATELFYFNSIKMISSREDMSLKYNKNFLNHNDTKIGKDYFISELERLIPGSCFEYVGNRKQKRQTHRQQIILADAVFDYVKFERHEFQTIADWFRQQVFTPQQTKGGFKDVCAVVDGFQYDFGKGGIHGSIDSTTVVSDDEGELWDWDVASYYPCLAIANDLFPEHLGVEFCGIYKDLFDERRKHAKGTVENAMLKLALNGVYGDSNSLYSPFYDPLYTMAITINGQLLLCMLAEQLIKIPNLKMIQVNTDGLTVKCPHAYIDHMKAVCAWWEELTRLELESAVYSRFMVRDVNNYIAEYDGSGALKRKGAYEYELGWHQNFSCRIVAKAAEAALVHGKDVAEFIRNHTDPVDFMLRTKVSRADTLTHGGEEIQRVSRYYISNDGKPLVKISQPAGKKIIGQWCRANKLTDQFYDSVVDELKASNVTDQELDATGLPWDDRINTKNRSQYKIRNTAIDKGYLTTICNDMSLMSWQNLNYDYYINEARKLSDPLMG